MQLSLTFFKYAGLIDRHGMRITKLAVGPGR